MHAEIQKYDRHKEIKREETNTEIKQGRHTPITN